MEPFSSHDVITEPLTAMSSAGHAAAAIRAGRSTAAEVTSALLARIAAVNQRVNAISEVDPQGAIVTAALLDESIARGEPGGSLGGVPMTVKDAFHAIGLHTTWGNPAFAGEVADWDAAVVARLRRAGAVIVGKSNVAMMLGDFGQSRNPLSGTTNNPWDLGRTSGGSSGGAAAAIASGLSYLEYGSDLVGSIRIPAAFCGVYGLKPTAGTVPLSGLQPPGPKALASDRPAVVGVGPLARSAGDLRLALQVTGGPDDADELAYRWELAPPRWRTLADYTMGVVLDHPACPVTTAVGDVLSNAIDVLARAGVTIKYGWPDGIDPTKVAESFGVQVGAYLASVEPGGTLDGLDYLRHEHFRLATRAAWADHFRETDAFLCPVTFSPPLPHDTRAFHERTIETPAGARPYTDLPFWIAQASLAGLPPLSAPAGWTATGLPVGVQILGPRHEDDTVITLAELMAEVIGGFLHPPLVSSVEAPRPNRDGVGNHRGADHPGADPAVVGHNGQPS
ncbi:amidase family protein [Arthrobacter glacialis]|uniref:amidase family protein n=1 Tax=Arthrobacter glacialis TaxID=1664 RepID=UPI001A9CCA89|nr:amidase family protein [Arthrobacter glacialis]